MTNKFKNTRIEFHILQSFPVTCLNRDDVGAPKSAIVGGVPRARVSSQCWKRQVRLAMPDFGIRLGVRSKKIAAMLSRACLALGASEAQAASCGETMAAFFSDDTLLFLSEAEANAFATYAQENGFEASKLKDKELVKVSKKSPTLPKPMRRAKDGVGIGKVTRAQLYPREVTKESKKSWERVTQQ